MRSPGEILKLVSDYIVKGKGVVFYIGGHCIRLHWCDSEQYCLWVDETDGNIAAIIYPDLRAEDYYSPWALKEV